MFDKLKAKISSKLNDAANKSMQAYFEYQAMLAEPTKTEGFNDAFTKIMIRDDKTLTCCCKSEINNSERIANCPSCDKKILWNQRFDEETERTTYLEDKTKTTTN